MRCSYILPKGEEDDQLDADDLQERLVLGNLLLQLHVQLDECEHGERDRDGLEGRHPYVGEFRTVGGFAVATRGLCNDGNHGEEDADGAVLEDADPQDLPLGR